MWRNIVNSKLKNKRKVVSKGGVSELNFELSPSALEQDFNEESKVKLWFTFRFAFMVAF